MGYCRVTYRPIPATPSVDVGRHLVHPVPMLTTLRRLRRATTLLVAAALLVLLPATALADLRSPRLESRCEESFSYSEEQIGPFLVEGCNKEGNPEAGERSRRLFKGTVEVNGLLVEPASGDAPLIATTSSGSTNLGQLSVDGRLKRSQAVRLVLDPLIGGQRRRIVIHNGSIDLRGDGNVPDNPGSEYLELLGGEVQMIQLARYERTDSVEGGGVVAHGARVARRLDIGRGVGSTSLPIGGTPALLGLRLFDLDDVVLGNDGMAFDAELKLGAGAPGLMRDVLGKATVELDDGTGMKISNLRFRVGHIGIPGVGGMDDFRVNYSADRDEWSGGFKLDLGDLFPGMDFSASVNASTGVPTAMQLSVAPLNIAVGPAIFLTGLRGGFDLSPLSFNTGASIAAGPKFGSYAVLTADGDVRIILEPNFRFETTGRVRVLPTGPDSQIARGDVEFIYDSTGLISLDGDARFDATFAGAGISASIGGSGAVSTSANVFNISARATGRLELIFTSVEVARLEAVISSDGFGTCGEVLGFLKGGIGQRWRGNLKVLSGCDLGPYRVNVARASRADVARAARAGGQRLQNQAIRTVPMVVRPGWEEVAWELSAERPGATVRLIDPDGNVVMTAAPGDKITEPGKVAGMAARDDGVGLATGQIIGVIALKNPKPGRYLLRSLASEPEISVRTASDARPLQFRVRTERAGQSGKRRLRAQVRGLEGDDQIQYGFRTPTGIEPIGDPVGADATLPFLEQTTPGRRQIVAQLVRDGVPLPGRIQDAGEHTAELPSIDGSVRARRQGRKLQVQARAKASGDRPQGFEYTITQNGKTGVFRQRLGKSLKVYLPSAKGGVRIEIHPVFRGVALERIRKVVRVR